jgi:hypothetical protein
VGDKQPVDRWKALHHISHHIQKDGDDEVRMVDGQVSTGSVDSDGEVLEQVSMNVKLNEWVADGGTPIAWMHDFGGSLGHAIEVQAMKRAPDGKSFVPAGKQDQIDANRIVAVIGRGYGFGTMLMGRVEVDDVWAQIAQKNVNKWSVHVRGYEAPEPDEATGAPLVITQRVLESSLVTVPAQREAVAAVARMLKSLGVQSECKGCRAETQRGLDRLGNMRREQWLYVVDHCKEHGQDHPDEVAKLAKALSEVGQALRS